VPDLGWDKFEWDDENKKNGNVQHLRDHRIEPEEAEECFFHDYEFCKHERRFDDVYIWMAEPIEEEDSLSFFRTKALGLLASLRVGI
jgi:hypothetical protein